MKACSALKPWEQRSAQASQMSKGFQDDAAKLEKDIGDLVDRIMQATNPRVIAAYEERIDQLEKQKLVALERAGSEPEKQRTFRGVFEHSLRFLSSPCKIWESGRFDLQRLVLKLAFPGHIQYCRENGFRTPQPSVPFNFLGDSMQNFKMVPRERIELSASSLPMMRSTTELPRRCYFDLCP